MNKYTLFGLLSVFLPVITFAGDYVPPIANDEFAYASMFAGNFSILLSVIIGVIATFLVFRAANKMGGGLFGSVLNYIATGMALIVLGTLTTIADSWVSDLWISFGILSTVFFALGYIFTVIGANKLFKGIMSN